MSDTPMTTTQTGAAALSVIAQMVQAQLIAKAKLMFLVQDETSRVAPGAKEVKFPRTGDLTPASKTDDGSESEAQALTYAVDTLALDQWKHTLVKLSDKADVQSVVNVEADVIERAGAGMALTMDTYIYGLLKAGASASSPDHILNHYGSSAAITRTKILEARKLLDNQNVPDSERFMVISPLQEAQVLDIDGFVLAQNIGGTAPVLNGEIGSLFGMRIIKTTVCEDNVTLYLHSSAAAFARQVEPKFETVRNIRTLSWEYSLSALYGAKILDSGKRHVVANASGS